MKVRDLTMMAMLVAIGTVTSHLVSIPTLGARVFPMQHAINVVAGIALGPLYAGVVAFLIAVLRNILGVGTLLAFPGGMVGAVLAGLLYRHFKKDEFALVGEIVGTGIFGALLAYPVASFLLGKDVLAVTYMIPFTISSIAGALMGFAAVKALSSVWKYQSSTHYEKRRQSNADH